MAYNSSTIYSYDDTTEPVTDWGTAKDAMNKVLGDNCTYEWKGESADKASIGLKE